MLDSPEARQHRGTCIKILRMPPRWQLLMACIVLSHLAVLLAGQSQHIAGEGLVQAMRAVPLDFFAEDFSLQKYAP